jgi:hypothetical protein
LESINVNQTITNYLEKPNKYKDGIIKVYTSSLHPEFKEMNKKYLELTNKIGKLESEISPIKRMLSDISKDNVYSINPPYDYREEDGVSITEVRVNSGIGGKYEYIKALPLEQEKQKHLEEEQGQEWVKELKRDWVNGEFGALKDVRCDIEQGDYSKKREVTVTFVAEVKSRGKRGVYYIKEISAKMSPSKAKEFYGIYTQIYTTKQQLKEEENKNEKDLKELKNSKKPILKRPVKPIIPLTSPKSPLEEKSLYDRGFDVSARNIIDCLEKGFY